MVDKSKYTIQVLQELLARKDDNRVTQHDFEVLYDAAYGNNIGSEAQILTDRIVKFLFSDGMIPWSFFQTPLGEAIGTTRFRDDTLTLPEIADYLNVSLQYVTKIVEQLKAKRTGKTWTVKESNLNAWLISKGKPTLDELRKKGGKVMYETEKEKMINPGYESEVEYK